MIREGKDENLFYFKLVKYLINLDLFVDLIINKFRLLISLGIFERFIIE